MAMFFKPYILQQEDQKRVDVTIEPATQADLAITQGYPQWQSDWNSPYLSSPEVEKYAMKTPDGELVALGAYQIVKKQAFVYILYLESAPHSNPTLVRKRSRKYYGIGEVLIAFGIKFSIDNGCRGDVFFEAKTDELAEHYERDFLAVRLPGGAKNGAVRFMLGDDPAKRLFSKYLSKEE
jgi:hypothetical protein